MQTRHVEDNVEIVTTYYRLFKSKRHELLIECDEQGNIAVENLSPMVLSNYRLATTSPDYVDCGLHPMRMETQLCSCGSGEYPDPVSDARGIYIGRMCDQCREQRLSGFRQDVLENPNYECDEPIEPEDY